MKINFSGCFVGFTALWSASEISDVLCPTYLEFWVWFYPVFDLIERLKTLSALFGLIWQWIIFLAGPVWPTAEVMYVDLCCACERLIMAWIYKFLTGI